MKSTEQDMLEIVKTTLVPSSRCRSQGLTLVEVLVVISVVTILMGLLIPAVQYARLAAARVHSLSNVRQIGLACIMFHDTRERLPTAPYLPSLADPPGQPSLATILFDDAGRDPRVFQCPMDTNRFPVEGLSYGYSGEVNGRRLDELQSIRGLSTWLLMRSYDPWFGPATQEQSYVHVYADGHAK